jgi:hypothetical protein
MSASQRYTGKNLVVLFYVGATEYVLSGDQTTLDVSHDIRSAVLTAGSDDFEYEKPTTQVLGATMTVLHAGTAGTASWGVLVVGTEGTLLYGPAGTATGAPKGGFPCFVKSKPMAIPRDEKVTRQIAFGPMGGTWGTTIFDPDTHQW